MTSGYLSVQGAADRLGKSTKTIRKYIKAGKLKSVMEDSPFGARYLIPIESVEALEVQGSPGSVSMGREHPEEDNLPVLHPAQMALEALDSLLAGREARMIEQVRQEIKAGNDALLAALEEARNKKGLWVRWKEKWFT